MPGAFRWIALLLAALVATSGCTATRPATAHINPSGTGMGFLTFANSGSVVGAYRVVVKGLDDTSPSQKAGAAGSDRVSIAVTISVSVGHYQYSAADFRYRPAGPQTSASTIPADSTSSPEALPSSGTLDAGQAVTGTLTFTAPPGHGEVNFNDSTNAQASVIWSVP
jgi:hypothetical protein